MASHLTTFIESKGPLKKVGAFLEAAYLMVAYLMARTRSVSASTLQVLKGITK